MSETACEEISLAAPPMSQRVQNGVPETERRLRQCSSMSVDEDSRARV